LKQYGTDNLKQCTEAIKWYWRMSDHMRAILKLI